jgi:predicted DNA-binding protein YlxM (UPF0122 family)
MDINIINFYLKGLATLEEIATLLQVPYKELCVFIKENKNIEPLEYQKKLHLETKMLIRNKLIELALEGDKSVLMFVAKTYLDNKHPIIQRPLDYSEFIDLLN